MSDNQKKSTMPFVATVAAGGATGTAGGYAASRYADHQMTNNFIAYSKTPEWATKKAAIAAIHDKILEVARGSKNFQEIRDHIKASLPDNSLVIFDAKELFDKIALSDRNPAQAAEEFVAAAKKTLFYEFRKQSITGFIGQNPEVAIPIGGALGIAAAVGGMCALTHRKSHSEAIISEREPGPDASKGRS